ncbi:hypothetical protein ACS78_08005 [Priestia megaterium]|uniref:hypothetical protein n=1 Tax=Priestia megaterium TaxID=1404 RepID=UPI0006833E8B|nr:hypothetical protein [Priestia megaterium]KNH23887.1 hypothetical protein ACS78_08005 [Priestia megaterium]
MNNFENFTLIDVPVIKSLDRYDLLNVDNITGYEPMFFKKTPKNKNEFVVLPVDMFDAFLNLSLDPFVDRLMIQLATMFMDGDELLIITKDGVATAGVGFLKDNVSLLLKEKTGRIGKVLSFSDIKFLAKVSTYLTGFSESQKEA